MEFECVSKHKSWLYWLSILMTIFILMVCRTQGDCIEEEREALLEIKASLIDSYGSDVNHHLPTWVDDTGIGGECCDWERVTCNTTTGHVTRLSLRNMMEMPDGPCNMRWPLNVSLLLHFKELRSLNLSFNCLDDEIVTTGLGRLSSLKKLEILDLSSNIITNETFPSLGALTSLRVLHLGTNKFEGRFPALALESLEILDLSDNHMEDFEQVSMLKKLRILNLGANTFNKSFITSLNVLPLLKSLDLSGNRLQGLPFPAEEISHLTNLETLDLSVNTLEGTPSIQDCKRLSRLKRLKNINIGGSYFDKNIITCLSALPSLKTLDLSFAFQSRSSFPLRELAHLPDDLEGLLLSQNKFNGTLPIEALASLFPHLQVLDLSSNHFVGSIPPTIQELSSLRVVSFAYNDLNGSLPEHGLCELENLHELYLGHNMFDGSLPQCFNLLSSLKKLDISSNRFTGILEQSMIANLTSLEYFDFRDNGFEGSFSFSWFSNHMKLEVVKFKSNNHKFEVETEEPVGWVPMFRLKVLVLSSCNTNRNKGSVLPGFLLHQQELEALDLSHNSLQGQSPNWLIENNTMLGALILRNNSFGGTICMPLHRNANTRWLDMSKNHMNGTIPSDIQKFLPNVFYLNLSSNSLDGVIPSSIGDMSELLALDLSDNDLSGEVPKGLFTFYLEVLKLSKNRLHGEVLSGNKSLIVYNLHLDNNAFTGKIGNGNHSSLRMLDISNNYFTGTIPHWIINRNLEEFVVRNNSFEGRFPCGNIPFSFLDISRNSFSGSIPSCLNMTYMKHLHLGSNRFTGSIPNVFRNLTNVLTLDIGNNNLSGRIPKFIGELSNLRILLLRQNNFSGSIPKQLCRLSYLSLIDLSSNSLSGPIPSCLQNITSPVYPAFNRSEFSIFHILPWSYLDIMREVSLDMQGVSETEDEVQFTTKALFLAYKGSILDYMVGLDLSDNKLTGEIPKELGLLTEIHSLNLSHNQLTGTIPMQFSNLENIESLDLSSNGLSGEVPSQLTQLTSLAVFNVSYNNLSGRLPEMKSQFSTFTEESYKGNPLLCGPPLNKTCTTTSQVNYPSTKEGNDKWYDIDMTSFYGSSGATWVVVLLGFVGVLYINPYWRRRWLDLVEECMYTCYYFLYDSVRKLNMLFR